MPVAADANAVDELPEVQVGGLVAQDRQVGFGQLVNASDKFADLTPADPVGDLREATGGRLTRSARYRTLNASSDLEDELRATLHAGGRSWGNLQLNRYTGGAPFTAADRAFLRAAAPLAHAIRERLGPGLRPRPEPPA